MLGVGRTAQQALGPGLLGAAHHPTSWGPRWSPALAGLLVQGLDEEWFWVLPQSDGGRVSLLTQGVRLGAASAQMKG